MLYPNTAGMGYVLCENPKQIIDYGMARIRPLYTEAYLKRLIQWFEIYKPHLVILRDYADTDTISKRIRAVIETFMQKALKHKIKTYHYTRADIKETFESFGKTTKYDISSKICYWYPELERIKPNPRPNTKSEHYRMGVF